MADPDPGDTMIEIDGLRYATAGRVIFDGLSLTIAHGKITAIMGPSGTGKTTLLRMITGQLRPSGGRVLVAGQDVPLLDRAALFRLRRRMGMLFQNSALLTDYSVFENVAFPVREHTRLPERLVRTLVLTKLHAVGLRGAAGLMPAELSGGMARRVALARAMVLDPDLILYDEPFSGLDPISMGMVLRLIKQTNDVLGITTVLVSHDVEEIGRIADYCYVVSGGTVIGAGTPAEIQHSDSPMVRQFITGGAEGPVPFHYPAPPYGDELLGGVP